MPAKGTKQVTKDMFNKVIRHLKAGDSAADIAGDNGISPSTVRTIRHAKTWAEFERRKAAKVAKVQAARKEKATKSPKKVAVSQKRSRAQRVAVQRPAKAASSTVSVDDIDFQHPATKGDLKAMEDRLQKHLDGITDVLTTHARDEAIHRANVELEKPQLHISRRLDNMDQSLLRIERVLVPVRRWFGMRRRG